MNQALRMAVLDLGVEAHQVAQMTDQEGVLRLRVLMLLVPVQPRLMVT